MKDKRIAVSECVHIFIKRAVLDDPTIKTPDDYLKKLLKIE